MSDSAPTKPSFTPRRRWTVGFNLAVRTLAVLAIVVLVNQLGSTIFHRHYLSESTRVELSPRTKNLLAAITNEVKVTIYFDRNDRFYPPIAAMLREYAALNPRLNVTTVDYLRDAAEAQRVKTAHKLPETDKAEEKNFVIFESGDESRVIPGQMLMDTAVEGDPERPGGYLRRATAFRGETAFTAMLLAVTNPKQHKAYVLQGHGEHSIESGDEISGYLDFRSLLEQNAVRVEALTLTGTNLIPADCNLLIIPGPRGGIPEPELKKIEQYLDEGGRLFALFNAASTDRSFGLEKILTKWGVLVSDSVVSDPANARNSIKMAPGADVTVGAFSKHPAVAGLQNYNLNLLAPRVVGPMKGRENVAEAPKVDVLFATENTARLVDRTGTLVQHAPVQQYPLAVAVEQNGVRGVVTGRGTTRMVVVGDSFFLANDLMKFQANRDFATFALNWLLDRPLFTEGIGPRPVSEYRITLTRAQMNQLQWMLLGAVPGGVLLLGGLVWWRRRK
jgi:ABC-2 type transport system permease protein